MKSNDFWKPGERSRLARLVGIRPHHLTEILHRNRRVSMERARKLEVCSGQVLQSTIEWETWMANETTDHPAFFGPTKEMKID